MYRDFVVGAAIEPGHDATIDSDERGPAEAGRYRRLIPRRFRPALRHGLKAVPYRCVFDAMYRDFVAGAYKSRT
jgi:hypothetical protein